MLVRFVLSLLKQKIVESGLSLLSFSEFVIYVKFGIRIGHCLKTTAQILLF